MTAHQACGVLSFDEARQAIGLGRTNAYRYIREHGELAPGIKPLPTYKNEYIFSASAVADYCEGQLPAPAHNDDLTSQSERVGSHQSPGADLSAAS